MTRRIFFKWCLKTGKLHRSLLVEAQWAHASSIWTLLWFPFIASRCSENAPFLCIPLMNAIIIRLRKDKWTWWLDIGTTAPIYFLLDTAILIFLVVVVLAKHQPTIFALNLKFVHPQQTRWFRYTLTNLIQSTIVTQLYFFIFKF